MNNPLNPAPDSIPDKLGVRAETRQAGCTTYQGDLMVLTVRSECWCGGGFDGDIDAGGQSRC